MRYPASEKAEIIRLVEQSHLPVAPNAGEARHPEGHVLPLVRSLSRPAGLRLWATVRPGPAASGTASPRRSASQIIDLALDEPELSPSRAGGALHRREEYFVSEASVYRLLKAHDLITSPAYIVIKAADEFRDKTTAPNQLWQTDFTYLKVTGWGWYYLSTVLDDFSRFIVAWKLCATMRASDVTETLDLALAASGLDQVTVVHRPRLLTDNGRVLHRGRSRRMARRPGHGAYPGRALPSPDAGQDRALASDAQEPHPARKLLPARRLSRRQVAAFVEHYNHARVPREPRQSHPRRRLLRTRPGHPPRTGKDQTTDHRQPPLAASRAGRLTSNPDEPEPPFLRARSQSQII